MPKPTATQREVYPISSELHDALEVVINNYEVREAEITIPALADRIQVYIGEYEHGTANAEDVMGSSTALGDLRNAVFDFFQYLIIGGWGE